MINKVKESKVGVGFDAYNEEYVDTVSYTHLNKMRRITFNEITKSAVKASIKQARDIDMNLVDEQQARRCLLYTSRCV